MTGGGLRARLEAVLQDLWWRRRPNALAWLLWPLSVLFLGLSALARRYAGTPASTPVPIIVVGNLVVGGAGKTPVVISLVHALTAAGFRPGVVSRGYGRRSTGVLAVDADATSAAVGDEPALIFRSTRVPVFVGERRNDAVQSLRRAHPEVDVLISDDGLQHHALHRLVEIWVFDERGVGNGLVLPAGPLRQRLPRRVPRRAMVVYNADRPSTPLPGPLLQRRLGDAVPLQAWWTNTPAAAVPLQSLRNRAHVAIAGIASPQRFFDMLDAAGLTFKALPLPDHASMESLPWPEGTTDVLCTEKDAVKLLPARCGATRVWVVPLDSQLPSDLLDPLLQRLAQARTS